MLEKWNNSNNNDIYKDEFFLKQLKTKQNKDLH